ncbi:MAG: winged helix-turn-helix domain-containing protein [Candidatus Aenigmatarchaeota archaeon]
MKLDKKTIKVLSSDTRVDMMKSLAERRKMPSELSKEMDLAASTVIGHLKQLKSANLVEKRHTGRKWIYYELTRKGRNLVKPKFPVQFSVMLTLGVIFMFVGSVYLYSSLVPAQLGEYRQTTPIEAGEITKTLPEFTGTEAPVSYEPFMNMILEWLWAIVFFIGLAFFAAALVIKYDLPLFRRSTWQKRKK